MEEKSFLSGITTLDWTNLSADTDASVTFDASIFECLNRQQYVGENEANESTEEEGEFEDFIKTQEAGVSLAEIENGIDLKNIKGEDFQETTREIRDIEDASLIDKLLEVMVEEIIREGEQTGVGNKSIRHENSAVSPTSFVSKPAQTCDKINNKKESRENGEEGVKKESNEEILNSKKMKRRSAQARQLYRKLLNSGTKENSILSIDANQHLNFQSKTRRKSSTGCWTCRLRHKKCDENKPTCAQCERLRIPCEGYTVNPPQYFSDPEKKRAKLKELKVAKYSLTKR